MKPETKQAIEEAREAYDENMGFIRCIKSDPRNIIHDAYEHALTLAIEEIEEKDRELQAKRLKIVEMYLKLGQARTENE